MPDFTNVEARKWLETQTVAASYSGTPSGFERRQLAEGIPVMERLLSEHDTLLQAMCRIAEMEPYQHCADCQTVHRLSNEALKKIGHDKHGT